MAPATWRGQPSRVAACPWRRRAGAIRLTATAARPFGVLGLREDVTDVNVRKVTGGIRLVHPENVDDVLSYYDQGDNLKADPYWAVPWPSAFAMAEYIGKHPELVKGRVVCDAGCGLGVRTGGSRPCVHSTRTFTASPYHKS